jgi:hypothetical protein
MPLVGFKPNKARLIVQQGSATVLVMRIATARNEDVLLASGGSLQGLVGVLRIRECSEQRSAKAARTTGSIVYIPEAGSGTGVRPARFQINIAMSSEKFATIMRLVAAGRLPAKLFVEVSSRPSALGSRSFGYVSRSGRQVKFWDTARHRLLPVTGYSMILPVDAREVAPDPWDEGEAHPTLATSPATNMQVAELADDLLVFQSETKHLLNGLVIAIVVICVLIGAVNLYPLFH